MHKQIVVSGDPAEVRALADVAQSLEGVISASLAPGASIKPTGDVLTIHVLNAAADDIMRHAQLATKAGRVNLIIATSTAFVDRKHADQIAHDEDEALWEEMESQLRNHGRLSGNYLLLMTLGGMIAAAALAAEGVPQAIAMVGASIIAPGFEPLAKVSQGLVLRRARLVMRAMLALCVGYLSLVGAAALAFAGLAWLGATSHGQLTGKPLLHTLTALDGVSLLPSVCAAVSGVLMVTSLRDAYVVGPLMVLVLISGGALSGAALAVGDYALAGRAAFRVAVDMTLVIVLGAGVFYWKQKTQHRRRLQP